MSENWKAQVQAAALKLLQRRKAEKLKQAADMNAAEWEDESDAVAQDFAERLERKEIE